MVVLPLSGMLFMALKGLFIPLWCMFMLNRLAFSGILHCN